MAVDLHRHQKTPFAEMTEKHEPIIFLAGDMVRGALVHDPELGWIGKVDWSTQDIWEGYPGAVAARGCSFLPVGPRPDQEERRQNRGLAFRSRIRRILGLINQVLNSVRGLAGNAGFR